MSGTRLKLLAIILIMLTLLSAGCSSAQVPLVTPNEEEAEQPIMQATLGDTEAEESSPTITTVDATVEDSSPTSSSADTWLEEPVLSTSLKRDCYLVQTPVRENFDNAGPGTGESAVNFTLRDIQGNEVRLSRLLIEKPVLMIFGSFT